MYYILYNIRVIFYLFYIWLHRINGFLVENMEDGDLLQKHGKVGHTYYAQ